MQIFFLYKYGCVSAFFSTAGIVANFDDATFYNSMYVAIAELTDFCDENEEFDISDFEVYMKGTVY